MCLSACAKRGCGALGGEPRRVEFIYPVREYHSGSFGSVSAKLFFAWAATIAIASGSDSDDAAMDEQNNEVVQGSSTGHKGRDGRQAACGRACPGASERARCSGIREMEELYRMGCAWTGC